MAAGRQSKPGVFTIPSLEEMKQAGKLPTEGGGPKIFKSTSSTDQRSGTVGQTSAPEAGKPHPLPQRPTEGPRTCSGSLGGRGGGSDGLRVEEGMEDGLERSNGTAKTRLRVDTATTTTTCPGGVTRGEGSGDGGAVMSTPTIAESSAGLALTHQHHPHAIITNPVQKKNPVMKHIRNVPWELGDIVPDFVLGGTTCALFLSVRYHSLHPDYIHSRLKELGKLFELRILLVLVDMTECQKVLHELARIAILANLTLLVAWSYEEAGRYLETYKAYENKPPDLLMERVEGDFTSQITESLTTVKKVNKTDAATLLNTYKTMEGVITASKEELTLCPGLGQQKAQRLYDLFHEPFVRQKRPGH